MIRIGLVLLVLIALAGCNRNGAAGPPIADGAPPAGASASTEPPTIVGEITRIGDRVLVEEQPGQANAGNKILFQVNGTTKLFMQDGDQLRSITADELAVGQRVQVWAAGPILESYPGQGTAGQLVVTGATEP